MKRRGFLKSVFGGSAAVATAAVVSTAAASALNDERGARGGGERAAFIKPGKFGFVRMDADVSQGDRLFCSSRPDGQVDAWKAHNDSFHAYALHTVKRADLWTGGRTNIVPHQLTVAVRFV